MVPLSYYLQITKWIKVNIMTTISLFIAIKILMAKKFTLPQFIRDSHFNMDTLKLMFPKLMFRLQFTQNRINNIRQISKIIKVITLLSSSIKTTLKLVNNINIKVFNQDKDLIMDNKFHLDSKNIELKFIQ